MQSRLDLEELADWHKKRGKAEAVTKEILIQQANRFGEKCREQVAHAQEISEKVQRDLVSTSEEYKRCKEEL